MNALFVSLLEINNVFISFIFILLHGVLACFSIDINDSPEEGQNLDSEQTQDQEVLIGYENVTESPDLSAPSAPISDNKATATAVPAPAKVHAPQKPVAAQPKHSAVYEEQKGDTPEYKGYTNPSMQSRTFKHLQEQLEAEEENNNSMACLELLSAFPKIWHIICVMYAHFHDLPLYIL